MSSAAALLPVLKKIHEQIRSAVVAACEAQAAQELARVEREGEGDTVYAVDRVGEEKLVELIAREVAVTAPLVLVAEGLPGPIVLPRGCAESDALFRIIANAA